jgi:hypothetical protein
MMQYNNIHLSCQWQIAVHILTSFSCIRGADKVQAIP